MQRIIEIFNVQLDRLGFTRSNKNFFLVGSGLTMVLNLQKSNYDRSYFLNVGLWLTDVGGENDAPKEYACHVRFRADSFLSREYPDLSLGDLLREDESGLAEQPAALSGLITDYVLPLIDRVRTIESLREVYRAGELSRAFIHKEARQVLYEG